MDRRGFLTGLASGIVAAPRAARAQSPAAWTVEVGGLRNAPDGPVFRL
jgi:hypothetical protein